MSRLLVLVHVTAVAALALARGDVILAASETPVRPVLAQKQLVSGTNCQTAASGTRKPDFLANSAEYRDDALITIRYCSATSHNQLTPNAPEIVVVGADPDASGGVRIFFKTIAKNDPKKVHDICVRAGKAASAYLQAATAATPQADAAMAGADVLTSSGKVECESFLRATGADSPLVVFAPGLISGSAVSVHILNMIGLKKPATEVQAAVDKLGHQVPSSVGLSTDEIRKYPQVVLGPQGLP
ncbi:MAG TPA: hypothetical protein VMT09_14955 [Steroidobacteraceae bacterium]|nr:hypothetical protein [Steroidobacteraceae bacterium]